MACSQANFGIKGALASLSFERDSEFEGHMTRVQQQLIEFENHPTNIANLKFLTKSANARSCAPIMAPPL